MKNGGIILLSAGLVALTVLSACNEKEIMDPVLNESGSLIVFGASTEWQNAADTRTEYSGKDENGLDISAGSGYERIDWYEGPDGADLIRILCDAAVGKSDASKKTADYIVTDVAVGSEKQTSTAGITPADNNSLHWGEGKHYFYALYPAPGTESNYGFTYRTVTSAKSSIESFSENRARVLAELPATQEVVKVGKEYKANMNYAYMYASTTATPGGTGSVVLGFKPLVTTFEIRLIAADAQAVGMKLKGVKLTSETGTAGSDLTGRFIARLNTDGTFTVTSKSSTSRSIEVPIAASAQQALDANNPLKITLLALPEDQTGLTLTLTFDKNGEEVQRKLPLRADLNEDGKIGTSEWIKVGAGQKIYISNLGVPGDVWHYTIEDVANIIINGHEAGSGTSAIKTYRSSGSKKEYVDVTFQYSADGTNYTSGLPSGLTSLSKNTGSEAVERKLTAKVGAHEEIAKVTYNDDVVDHARILATRSALGTSSNPYDLSTHKVMGEERSEEKQIVTSNSYVVTAPGYYRFPMVYGNAIDMEKKNDKRFAESGGGNVKAYKYNVGSNSHVTDFQRFDGNPITMPSILNDLGLSYADCEPVVVWQDVPAGEEMITEEPIIRSNSATWPLAMGYICFKIDQTQISEDAARPGRYKVKGARQGNIVIALRLKAAKTIGGKSWPKGTILWSWHIWVTDNDLTAVRVNTRGNAVKNYNYMMPYHLGWCDERVYEVTTYKTRTWYVKATQTQKNPSDAEYQSKVFKVIQKGDNVMDQIKWSASTCYQWGRKDPLLPGYNAYKGTDLSPESINPTNKPWSSPNNAYNIVDTGREGYLNVSTEDMDIPETIRLPYVFNCGGSIHFNLWNANADGDLQDDITVYKTVYDPCPPGFSLPHMWAFSNFNTEGTNAEIRDTDMSHINAKDVNGDGEVNSKDFTLYDGWYFYTGVGNNTIFFPGTTGRVNTVSYVRYYHSGYIWTAAIASNEAAHNGGFDLHYTSSVAFPWTSGTSHALTVRPVAE